MAQASLGKWLNGVHDMFAFLRRGHDPRRS